MIPATQADIDQFKSSIPPFAASLADDIEPYASDPIPPINTRGGRAAEGFKAVFTGTVQESWCNYVGSMHGAAASWIVDNVTSSVLFMLHTPTFWGPPMLTGVSLALDMSYYDAAPAGSKLRIVVNVERLTGALANLRCDVSDWETGKRICSGTHIKTWRAMGGDKKGKKDDEQVRSKL